MGIAFYAVAAVLILAIDLAFALFIGRVCGMTTQSVAVE
jgi:hypothetical protein